MNIDTARDVRKLVDKLELTERIMDSINAVIRSLESESNVYSRIEFDVSGGGRFAFQIPEDNNVSILEILSLLRAYHHVEKIQLAAELKAIKVKS